MGRFLKLAAACLLVLFGAGANTHDYSTRYAEAQREGSLIVVVSAKWCAPCRSLEQLLDKAGVEYAILDVDNSQDRVVIDGMGIVKGTPQFIVWTRTNGSWTKLRFPPGSVPVEATHQASPKKEKT